MCNISAGCVEDTKFDRYLFVAVFILIIDYPRISFVLPLSICIEINLKFDLWICFVIEILKE